MNKLKEITEKEAKKIYNKIGGLYHGFMKCPICDSKKVIYVPHSFYVYGCLDCGYGFFAQYFTNGLDNNELINTYINKDYSSYHKFKVIKDKEKVQKKATKEVAIQLTLF